MNDGGVIIGIDNGLDGGLVALSSVGDIIECLPMPTLQVADKKEVDPKAVVDFVLKFDKCIVGIEEPLRFAPTSQAIRSMAISFGKCIGACAAFGIDSKRIQVKEWQDVMLGKGLPKGQTKSVALKKANQIWPNEKWLATKRSKVAHDGLVDAGLIAEYIRSKLL